jgi:hypothetical protein
MWHPEPIDELQPEGRWLVRSRSTDGYLANNGPSGGAIHFRTEDEAYQVCELLNAYQAA